MALLTNVTILLVLACISHQLMLGSSQRGQGRQGRGADRGQNKDKSGLKVGHQDKSASAQQTVGKLVTKDKWKCTWAASGEDLLILSITCKKGGRSFSCQYAGRPQVCQSYTSNIQLFWVQIGRALKRQKNLCQDSGSLVRARMCRGAARDAHFRLRVSRGKETARPNIPPSAITPVKSCQPDNKKRAEEFCSDSWSSFCTFLFTMVQDYDC
ncbi:fibroblast growth factor-binding protein 1 [Pholidichthys leucotaenia]